VSVEDWALAIVSVIAVAATTVAVSAGRRARRAAAREKEVVDGRAEIASMVVHELRGPLSTLRGLAATTSKHYDRLSDAERRELLRLIEQESRRMVTTADQVSLALNIDAAALRFDFKPAELAGVIREGIDEAEVGAHPIEVDAPDDLIVRCDRRWLGLVVRQLVDNAAKFSPPEAPIRVNASRKDDHAMLEVLDEGPGIPPDKRRAMFAKFPNWRPAGYEEQPGSGLGLFICEALVAEHHGGISIEGGPAGGTMLRIRLPAEG
jgi:two-component system, OmpR family, sensor histidine kinase KdpD